MASEILWHEIPTDTISSPINTIDDFSAKRQKELLSHYPLGDDETIDNFAQVLDILSSPSFKDQKDALSIALLSFPLQDKDSLNTLYTTLLDTLSNPEKFEIFEIDPLNRINEIIGQIKTKIENKKIEQEKIKADQKNIELKNQEYNTFLSEYNNTQTERNTLSKKFDKSITLDKLNPSDLKVFQDVFVYELQSKNKPLTPQAQQDINTKILNYIRYQAYLRQQKPEQLTTTQRSQKEYFEKFLDNSGINNEDFFGWFIKENKEKNRPTTLTKEPESKTNENTTVSSSTDKWLWNLSASFEQINTQNMKVSPIFTDELWAPKSWFERDSLLKNFPLPKGTTLADFRFENTNSSEFISQLINNGFSHPLIEASTSDRESRQRANKSLVVYLLYKANPTTQQIPESLAKIIYPPKSGNTSWINKIPKQKQLQYIEDKLLVPLMKNNFCSNNTEQFVWSEIKKWYMWYLSKLMEKTPALEDFKINPEETEFTNKNTKIPLHLDNPREVSGYLTIEDGKIYLTNTLYNPHDTEHQNQISTGKVYVGDMLSFDDFTNNISKSINEDTMKSSLQEKNPYDAYHETIKNTITTDISQYVKKIDSTSSNIAHGLSGTKVQDSIFDLMKTRHTTQVSNNTSISQDSPFYNALRDYTLDNKKTISKKEFPDTFESLALVRTTMLRNSANENKTLEDSLHTLQILLKDINFNKKIEQFLQDKQAQWYDNLSPLDQQRYMLLQTLNSTSRQEPHSLSLFLQVFGNNPQQPQHNSIDINKLQNTIQQLSTQNDLWLLSLHNIHQHTIAKLENKYAPSADENLEHALSTLDTDKKEIWK